MRHTFTRLMHTCARLLTTYSRASDDSVNTGAETAYLLPHTSVRENGLLIHMRAKR